MSKILIVDDQQQDLYMLKSLLMGNGYQVVEATNGAEALGLARTDPPDVIISDILMPVMDGFSLCHEWTKNEFLKNIPFVFYTATYTDPKDEELALNLGAARFIVKPTEIEEFISILKSVIAEVEAGVVTVPQETLHEEMTYYRMYNERLIRKLEDKLLELEKANHALEEDIIQRRQIEKQLRTSEQKFSVFFEKASFTATLARLPNGVMIDVNEAFERAFGYTKQEAIGKTSLELGINPDADGRERVLTLLREQGSAHGLELVLHTKSGEARTHTVNVDLVEIGDEKYILNTTQDITERKQAEEKLHRQNQRLKALWEIDTAILAADSVENIVSAALDHILELIGCPRSGLALIDWETNKAVNFEVRADKETSISKGASTSLAPIQETIQILMQNQPILINDLTMLPDPPLQIQSIIKEGLRSVCILPLFSQSQLIGSFSMSSEIPGFFDEEKINLGREVANQVAIAINQNRLIEQLQHLNAYLEQRVQERTADLEATNKELDAFSYSVSHDLRSPLRAVDGYAGLLSEQYAFHLPAEAQRYLESLRANSQRMSRLIEDLLKLSRVSRKPLRRVSVNLSELAYAITAELIDGVPERSVKFIISDGLTTKGDPGLLQIVMENLLRNAWKYTSKREWAHIEFGSIMQEEDRKTFFVRDDGVGFDMAYADKLFGSFQRLHSETDFEGTGIGLATVQRIIHRHGGRIWAEAAPDKGATFYFVLEKSNK